MLKKSILTNLKIPDTVFLHIPFFKLSKKHTYESHNTWHSFFAHPLFQILKKHTYESRNTWQSIFAHPFFQILKKLTYESQNTLFILIIIIILKETIHIKTIIQTIPMRTIIQIDKHKLKYIIIACISKLL